MNEKFTRLENLPTYVFNVTAKLKNKLIKDGIDVVDFSMGNPDQSTPEPIINEMVNSLNLPGAHRYTESQGIPELRKSMSQWLEERFNVNIDYEDEVIVTLGSKEGISHLSMAMINPGDKVFVPEPCYPIHRYAFVLAGAEVVSLDGLNTQGLLSEIKEKAEKDRPKVLVLNYPNNPTTECVDLGFFEEVVAIAKKYDFWIIHDLAYADISFDGYHPPSIMQVEGAKDIAVEAYSMSKSFHMPGWRIGFVYGNRKLISALKRIKSYYDYGTYGPIQKAAAYALQNHENLIPNVVDCYLKRRDYLISSFKKVNWSIESPKATMFLWAKIPEQFSNLSSTEFSDLILKEAHVSVTPGSAFGKGGDKYIRISLIEDNHRVDQAVKNLAKIL